VRLVLSQRAEPRAANLAGVQARMDRAAIQVLVTNLAGVQANRAAD